MAAYQCLVCTQIERGEEDCCDAPDLFCINDMPSEIVALRAALTMACGGDKRKAEDLLEKARAAS